MSEHKLLKPTNIFQRLFCVTISPPPADAGCWNLTGDKLEINLTRAPELQPIGRSIRLEDDKLPDRVLLVHADDGTFHAFRNRCACGGFRIDPVPGEAKVRCCTPMQSTYDLTGKPTGRHPDKDVETLAVTVSDGLLTVDITPLRQPAPHTRKT
jgi:nitrite reductase/ring-hydroxylating ferredoxin subunit